MAALKEILPLFMLLGSKIKWKTGRCLTFSLHESLTDSAVTFLLESLILNPWLIPTLNDYFLRRRVGQAGGDEALQI